MRKALFLVLVIEVIFLIGIFSPPAFSKDFPRHKDPAEIQEESFLPAQLISLYGVAVSLQIAGKWDEALSELRKTLQSYIPENLKYIFTRFNELIQSTGNRLKAVQGGINSAQSFLHHGKVKEAKEKLENAWADLLKARRNFNNLDSSIDELKVRIGESAARRLRKEIAPLGKLADDCENKIKNLYQEIKAGKRLEQTFLQISAYKRRVFVGTPLKIYGKLTTEKGDFLAGREVGIFLEKNKLLTVITGEDGGFEAWINLPFLYKREIRVWATFDPEGEDKEAFYASTSNIIKLEPIFYTPLIKANYSAPVYPVLPFEIKGKLVLEGMPLPDYPVEIKVARKLVRVKTDREGKFKTLLSLPAGAGGKFPVSFHTPPGGIIGPASLIVKVPVSYRFPWMKVELPLIVTPPFPLRIKGQVKVKDGSMIEPVIRVITETDDVRIPYEGEKFEVRLGIPLSRFSGWETVSVFLYPKEPWISSISEKGKVLVINPVTLLPFIGLLALFAGVVYRRKREIEEVEKVFEERKEEKEVEKPLEPGKKLSGLIRIYIEAVEKVTSITGIRQTPSHTIREYLYLVKEKLEEKGEDFEFISIVTEKFLYAPGKISEKQEREAQEALERLKK